MDSGVPMAKINRGNTMRFNTMRDRAEQKLAQKAAQAKYRAENRISQRKCHEKRKSKAEQERDAVKRLTSIYDSAMRAIV